MSLFYQLNPIALYMYQEQFMRQALELAEENIKNGGRPFGAVLVKDDEVLAAGANEVHLSHDVTAHAELLAVRRANKKLRSPDLTGAVMYASGQPCPMCMSAMYAANIRELYFAYSYEQGAPFGLSSEPILEQLKKPVERQNMNIRHVNPDSPGKHLYERWTESADE